uniref:Uncharacterized protein n=1 Tax=Solanum lycopersicum TaxID=4081 RepID=A0A3Q7FGX8_SOLLC
METVENDLKSSSSSELSYTESKIFTGLSIFLSPASLDLTGKVSISLLSAPDLPLGIACVLGITGELFPLDELGTFDFLDLTSTTLFSKSCCLLPRNQSHNVGLIQKIVWLQNPIKKEPKNRVKPQSNNLPWSKSDKLIPDPTLGFGLNTKWQRKQCR